MLKDRNLDAQRKHNKKYPLSNALRCHNYRRKKNGLRPLTMKEFVILRDYVIEHGMKKMPIKTAKEKNILSGTYDFIGEEKDGGSFISG